MRLFKTCFHRRGFCPRCLSYLIVLYVLISSVIFIKFHKTIFKYASDNLNNGGNLADEDLWKIFDACSEKYLQIDGHANYVCTWFEQSTSDSTNSFTTFGSEFAELKNVIVDPQQSEGHRGGENMTLVWNQSEEPEYLKLKKSYFTLPCDKIQSQPFTRTENHLNDWISVLTCRSNLSTSTPPVQVVTDLTIAVQRFEYVNIYHTMTDFYNAFLIMILFRKSPQDVNILFIDAHPFGSLDDTWKTLFKRTYRAGALASATQFSDLIWGISGYNSPLSLHELPFVPYLDEFRHFFLKQHGVQITDSLTCDKLKILFIWRRNYVAHPRNPEGTVSRKIKNEDELVSHVIQALPGHDVTGLQLDRLNMVEQLRLISRVDILLGMHGAGLTHTLFLPKHSGLIEFYPTYWPESSIHFLTFAHWRGLHYSSWKNHDPSYEYPDELTYISPQIVVNMVIQMKNRICRHEVK